MADRAQEYRGAIGKIISDSDLSGYFPESDPLRAIDFYRFLKEEGIDIEKGTFSGYRDAVMERIEEKKSAIEALESDIQSLTEALKEIDGEPAYSPASGRRGRRDVPEVLTVKEGGWIATRELLKYIPTTRIKKARDNGMNERPGESLGKGRAPVEVRLTPEYFTQFFGDNGPRIETEDGEPFELRAGQRKKKSK